MAYKDLKKEICSFCKTDLGGNQKTEKEVEDNVLLLNAREKSTPKLRYSEGNSRFVVNMATEHLTTGTTENKISTIQWKIT